MCSIAHSATPHSHGGNVPSTSSSPSPTVSSKLSSADPNDSLDSSRVTAISVVIVVVVAAEKLNRLHSAGDSSASIARASASKSPLPFAACLASVSNTRAGSSPLFLIDVIVARNARLVSSANASARSNRAAVTGVRAVFAVVFAGSGSVLTSSSDPPSSAALADA